MKSFFSRQIKINPLISICIVTCNQSFELDLTLKSILSQKAEDLEIIIRDDSADNESEKIVMSYIEKLPIRYFHGKKEGVDKAVIFVTEQANGKYVWWFGDDIIAQGAIDAIVAIINKYPEITFMYVNSKEIDSDNLALNIGQNRFFDDNNEVMERIGDMLGYLSADIFKRDVAIRGIKLACPYIGSAWVTLFLALYVLSQPGKYFFIQDPYVLGHKRPETGPSWYDPFQIFCVGIHNILMDRNLKKNFSKKSIKKMLANNFNGTLQTLLVKKAKGIKWGLQSNFSQVKVMFSLYWRFIGFWIAIPLILMPGFLLKCAYIIYKFFFRKTKSRF